MDITRIRRPRCYLLYALAPEGVAPADANQVINAICADETLPLALYHDHFIGQIGGMVIFYADSDAERTALQNELDDHLATWTYTLHPLIYSHSPAALDEQIAYTLRAYREQDWHSLRHEKRPSYGDPHQEAHTGKES